MCTNEKKKSRTPAAWEQLGGVGLRTVLACCSCDKSNRPLPCLSVSYNIFCLHLVRQMLLPKDANAFQNSVITSSPWCMGYLVIIDVIFPLIA